MYKDGKGPCYGLEEKITNQDGVTLTMNLKDSEILTEW